MKKHMLRLVSFALPVLATATAFAQEGHEGESSAAAPFAYLAAGLGIGIAVLGGALGQSRAAAAALEGMARNPGASDKLFTPMLLALALMESLVLFAFVITFQLLGK